MNEGKVRGVGGEKSGLSSSILELDEESSLFLLLLGRICREAMASLAKDRAAASKHRWRANWADATCCDVMES